MADTKCKDLVKPNWLQTKKDLKTHLKNNTLKEYVLCADLVEKGTFSDQKKDFYRIQFSWGGPQDELRVEGHKIEYWYLDWFDGACIDVTNDPIAIEIVREYLPYFK